MGNATRLDYLDLGRAEATRKQRILRMSPVFRHAPGEVRDALLEVGRLARARRRARLVVQGQRATHAVLLSSGRVRVSRTTRGKSIDFLGPGDLLGLTAALGPGPADESAQVVEDVIGLAFPAADLRELVERSPRFRALLIAEHSALRQRLEERLESLLLHKVEARLAATLLHAADRWGEPVRGGVRISAAFRHHELASLIGAGREWVTMILSRLRAEGLLRGDGRRIVVVDRTALRRLAGLSS